MKRQQAFTQTGNAMLKGGLHCHTKRSDGCDTPEVLLGKFRQNGYDFVAITDHNRYNLKNYAPETGIIVVPGMEIDRRLSEKGVHCYHSVCLGPVEGNGYQQDEHVEGGGQIVSGQEEFQKVLDRVHANNNLTIYCHPQWSATPAHEFNRLKGNFAMEIWNSISVLEHNIDMDASCWDELLRDGIRIYGVATDDVHYLHGYCHGWVRVNAKPDVDSILSALRNGEFYSSCGPEIYDFYVEDGKAVVECSPVNRVRFHYGYRPTQIVRAKESTISRAVHEIPDYYTYIRASIVDEQGRMAWTNPIFLDD